MVVLVCTVPPAEFVFETLLDRFPDVNVEFERVLPTNHHPLPYLWADGDRADGVADAIAADPAVADAEQVALFEDGALYHVDWRSQRGELLTYLTTAAEGVTLLEATASGGEWCLRIRFPSREAFSAFRTFYLSEQLSLHVVRLYDLENPKLDKNDLSEKQREGLLRALEMGYFEIPREATLEEVADSLDITAKSLSERLRRGQNSLIGSSLTMGRPDGVGVDEQ